ncbi:Peroxidase, putative [Angomonas deanei]|uniref:Peroxidase, putative n=1 Tax=Angomonas deanei TaxID=59799 RepID=A0A7G2CRF3_9TRYP|nr:Peroxidase, putative [Angomonas deanei]
MWRAVCGTSSGRRVSCALGTAAYNSVRQKSDKKQSNPFKAPPNVGPGREHDDANPYKSWQHLSHKWLLVMCVGCVGAGMLAGQLVEVDETKLKPKFAKEKVIEAACKEFEFRPDLAATSIRVAFVLAARRAGFPAESIGESCAVVEGLDDVAGVMNFLANKFNGTMEDMVSLAAVAGVKYLNGPCDAILDEWQWGRNDTDNAISRNIPTNPDVKQFSIPTILKSLGDLTDEECVALMACHSVGEFHAHVSGIDAATHIGKRFTLSPEYYRFLLENEKKFSHLTVDRTEENKVLKDLNQSFSCVYVKGKQRKRMCVFNENELDAMLHHPAWRNIVVNFAVDEKAWSDSFQSAFTKMINSNFKRLRVYSDPDE